jgi:Flp pilus assembly pilin Flp
MPNRHNIKTRARSAMVRRCGQTMTEYALIMAAIAIVAIVAYTTLGTTITDLINKVIACL